MRHLPSLDDVEHLLVKLERVAAANSRSASVLLKGRKKEGISRLTVASTGV